MPARTRLLPTALPGARRRFAAGGAYASHEQPVRGLHRVADDTLDQYEVFIGAAAPPGAEPDFTAAPDQTEASLPFDVVLPLPGAGNTLTYKVVVRKRSKWNLSSANAISDGSDLSSYTLTIDENGDLVAEPPSAPENVRMDAASAGTVRVRADYVYGADGPATASGGQADTWLIYLTTNGVDPDPDIDAVHATATMAKIDGYARLDWTSAGQVDGTTVKAVVRTRRSASVTGAAADSDSINTTPVVSAEADTDGPAAPGTAVAFFADAAKQKQ